MTEQEKMLKGLIYDPSDKILAEKRVQAHDLCMDFNSLHEGQTEQRTAILQQLFPHLGEGTDILAPIHIDYGEFTTFGKRCFANFNLTILDTCPVTVGNDVFFGCNCSILTPLHPLIAEERNLKQREDGSYYDLEYGAPITIGDGCWIASDVKICGGVTIGEGCVIGAGSVVTRDIPAYSLAVGNPCRVIRQITENDSIYLKNLF